MRPRSVSSHTLLRTPRIVAALRHLTDREREVLWLRYVEALTYKMIGLRSGFTLNRAVQLCHRGELRLAVAIAHPTWTTQQIRSRANRALRQPDELEEPQPADYEPEPPPPLRARRAWTATRYGRRAEPFGTLDEILDALHPFPIEEKTRLVEAAVDFWERGITRRR